MLPPPPARIRCHLLEFAAARARPWRLVAFPQASAELGHWSSISAIKSSIAALQSSTDALESSMAALNRARTPSNRSEDEETEAFMADSERREGRHRRGTASRSAPSNSTGAWSWEPRRGQPRRAVHLDCPGLEIIQRHARRKRDASE
ncbi:hypothetical protein C2845_PM01G29580 [Panicum miliaceum]|uniref:Uncharacterized protein n=1 Tax=Panicum miliaceum TaxID=4540 RepID=A0A3L6TEP4_PANMI|nr:hypothetical protein C2845_PM01G29580 [Panicum miliaceum]